MGEQATEAVLEFVRPITDDELRDAIKLRTHEAFRAMNIANSIGGRETVPWWIVRNYSLTQLRAEAERRKLVLVEAK